MFCQEEEAKTSISQPYNIWRDIKRLTQQLIALSELPREGSKLLLEYFESEDAKRELDILASNFMAYKNSNRNQKKKDVEVKSPKAGIVLHDFNVQGRDFCVLIFNIVSNLIVKLIMVQEFEIANEIFECLKNSMYGLARSSLFNNTAWAKVLGNLKNLI